MVWKNAGVPLCSATSEILARPRCDVPTEGNGFMAYFRKGSGSKVIAIDCLILYTKATDNQAHRRQGRPYTNFQRKTLSGSDPVALLQAENQSAGRRKTSAAVKCLPH